MEEDPPTVLEVWEQPVSASSTPRIEIQIRFTNPLQMAESRQDAGFYGADTRETLC
jgi:hypothetical protein